MKPRHTIESGYASPGMAIRLSGLRPFEILSAIHGDGAVLPRIRMLRRPGRQMDVSVVDAMRLASTLQIHRRSR
jgi:hypothetical protein